MLGRIFDGSGKAIDKGPKVLAEDYLDINGSPINPYSRVRCRPAAASSIELISSGVPRRNDLYWYLCHRHHELDRPWPEDPHLLLVRSASQRNRRPDLPTSQFGQRTHQGRQGRTRWTRRKLLHCFRRHGCQLGDEPFLHQGFRGERQHGACHTFLELGERPYVSVHHSFIPTSLTRNSIERIITPRLALTTAEYYAYQLEKHVLVILTDLSSYCDALREVSAAREEVPGRRGYPGYMYTDLSTIYERAGRVEGRNGSITQIPILTMPNDGEHRPMLC